MDDSEAVGDAMDSFDAINASATAVKGAFSIVTMGTVVVGKVFSVAL